MMTKQNWQAVGKIGLLGLVILVLTRLLSEVAFLLAQPLAESMSAFDPDGSFLYISLHHIWQGVFALFTILILARSIRIPLTQFGFNLNEWRLAVRGCLSSACPGSFCKAVSAR